MLQPDQAALVFDMNGRMSLVLPNLPDDAPVPAAWSLLLAIAARCEDPEWVMATIEAGSSARPH
ncbi:MAG: hypothetical protein ACTHM2_10200 [Afipia sp.]